MSPPPPTSPLRPWVRFLPGRSNDGFLHSFGLLPALGGRREENGLQQLHAGGEGGVPSSEREEEGLFWPAVEAKGEAKGKSAKGLFPLLLVLRLLYLLRLRFDFPRKRSPPSLGGRTNPSLERKGGKRGLFLLFHVRYCAVPLVKLARKQGGAVRGGKGEGEGGI